MVTGSYHGYIALPWLQIVTMVTKSYHGYRELPWLQRVTMVTELPRLQRVTK